MEELREMFDYEEDETIEIPPNTNPHAVATTLKKYLQELPNCLMTFALYEQFMGIASEKHHLIFFFFLL